MTRYISYLKSYISYFQNLQSQMTEFEASAEPLQDWLNSTEVRVQESSARLHDLPAKKQELSKLQVLSAAASVSSLSEEHPSQFYYISPVITVANNEAIG